MWLCVEVATSMKSSRSGGDDALGHADVGRVGSGVLARERVGEVRVEQQVPPGVLDEESALPQPPEAETVVGRFAGGLRDIVEEGVAGEGGFDHG